MPQGMSIAKIADHMFDYDNLKDVNLSPSLAAKWNLKTLTGQGLCTIKVRHFIAGLIGQDIFEHPFNRGLGQVYNAATTNSIVDGFSKLAFGLITVSIMENVNNDPGYPPVFLMLADAHNRAMGLVRANEAGLLSQSDLDHNLTVQVVPASQFIEVYGLLNTCRSQTGAEKYTHPVLRYGAIIFELAQQAGLDTIEKGLAGQIAYLVEYYENNPMGQSVMYADTFDARTVTKKKALHRATDDPIVWGSGKRSKIVAALQWLTAVRNNVDNNLGGKLLKSGPFMGMLLTWYVRNEPKIGRSASRFAKKLDRNAYDLRPLMACITHSGDTTITSTESQILKIMLIFVGIVLNQRCGRNRDISSRIHPHAIDQIE